tara:strand:- start:550 stop:828 length:279 start_codon:yes stop_codon:yes gene_type:complete
MASESEAVQTQTQSQETTTREVSVLDVEVTNENVALNVMVALLNMAQRRGVYTMQESAKAWECVQKFMRPAQSSDVTGSEQQNVTMNVSESK